ncbi:hypothetical protein P4S72_08070 [Vibrio sp. PP-XX7]
MKPLFDRDVVLVRSWVKQGCLRDIAPEHLFISYLGDDSDLR